MKRILARIMMITLCFFISVRSYAAPGIRVHTIPEVAKIQIPDPGTVVTRTDQITQEQFDQILSTLRRMKNNSARGNYNFYDTGVRCQSAEEAKAVIQGFKELFLADNAFILHYNDRGWRKMYVEPKKNSNGRYRYWMRGEGGGTRSIYVVWKPDVDPEEMLRQHDEAKKVVEALVASAPQDAYEKVKHYHDILVKRITYDLDGYLTGKAKQSPYYGLVEGSCVCTGYAESFFNLCYYSGIPCAVSDCVSVYSADGMPDHKISMVNLNGRWKEVDVTWDDSKQGLNYNYYMVDLDDVWQNHINGAAQPLTGL